MHAFTGLEQIRPRGPGREPAATQLMIHTRGLAPGQPVEVMTDFEHVVAQKVQPVAYATFGKHAPKTRRKTAAARAGAQSPKTHRRKPEYEQFALAREHTIGLAHEAIRVALEL